MGDRQSLLPDPPGAWVLYRDGGSLAFRRRMAGGHAANSKDFQGAAATDGGGTLYFPTTNCLGDGRSSHGRVWLSYEKSRPYPLHVQAERRCDDLSVPDPFQYFCSK